MDKFIEKPHVIFLSSILLMILTVLISGNKEIDIANVHNTYYVIQFSALVELISILFGFIGLVYWFLIKFNKNLSRKLNLGHTISTISGVFIIMILFFIDSYKLDNLKFIFLLIIILSQTLFIINIIRSLIKK